jgi:hypothetical protein
MPCRVWCRSPSSQARARTAFTNGTIPWYGRTPETQEPRSPPSCGAGHLTSIARALHQRPCSIMRYRANKGPCTTSVSETRTLSPPHSPAAERRHTTERMGSPTLQTLQDPILPWVCFRGGGFQPGGQAVWLRAGSHTPDRPLSRGTAQVSRLWNVAEMVLVLHYGASPHALTAHMILREDRVDSRGRWKRPSLQTAHMTL